MDNNVYVGRLPAVFISSTCYDLKQIRSDLKDYIEKQLGFDAILSEYDTFPLNPNIGTVENCIRTVKSRADIFVLIVGNRYGSITNTGKSVTNLEYINAKAKGIPIYAFVDKQLFSIMPIWQSNPTADFSSTVDSSKLFDFVNELRGKDNIWVYGFESAQDIISILKKQIGYLLYDSLNLRKQICMQHLSAKVMQLEGELLKIVLEKPVGWEYLLLGEAIENQFKHTLDLKMDLIYGVSFDHIKELSDVHEIVEWICSKNTELLSITDVLSTIFYKAIPVALGAPGVPGDADHILYVAERIGRIYEEIIKWGLSFKSISVPEDWQNVINALSKVWESPISDLEKYCDKYHKAKEKFESISNESEEIDLTLKLTEPNLKAFHNELNILRVKYGLMQD